MEAALDGKDSDQTSMMSESCILVDNEDVAIGSLSKLESHYMAGSLHRAFSVLLFNSKDELLVQKRASSKITFPSVWANSCCSHPLMLEGAQRSPSWMLPFGRWSRSWAYRVRSPPIGTTTPWADSCTAPGGTPSGSSGR